MTSHDNTPTVILVPGHWLGVWAWDDVMKSLVDAGRRAVALTLPGLDPDDPERRSRTLDEQAAAIEDALRAVDRPAILVAHSGANAPVSLVLDRHPELVGHVVWVDSGPAAPGSIYAPDLPADVLELPLPDFETLARQASLDGLTERDLDDFRRRAIPEPAPVLRQALELSNDARLAVPTTIVCCSLPSAKITEMAEAGHPMFAEVAALKRVDFVDLPTGHWPMWSRPDDLARAIAAVG